MRRIQEGDLCSTEGCQNKVSLHHIKDGVKYYRRKCTTCRSRQQGPHKRLAYVSNGKPVGRPQMRPVFDTSKCSRCGWDEAVCDCHRVVPGKDGGLYTEDNVEVLCPNCHRVAHSK